MACGLGTRRICHDAALGPIEVLDVRPSLATAAAEQDIRGRAARLAGAPSIAAIRRIDRDGGVLSITTDAAPGVRLQDLLESLAAGAAALDDAALLALAGAIVRAVAALHELPGALAHGALTPDHIVVRRDATVVLTDALFTDVLQALDANREQLWREFGLPMPPSASLPRFDQRADVAQLGMVVLALALRRPLRVDEYPRATADLVIQATTPADPRSPLGTALRMWLQQALQLHPRGVFGTATEAAFAFAAVTDSTRGRRRAAPLAAARRDGLPHPRPN